MKDKIEYRATADPINTGIEEQSIFNQDLTKTAVNVTAIIQEEVEFRRSQEL